MKTIYLDRNIILRIFENQNPKLEDTLGKCKGLGYIFPYSPAHIEEIAGADKLHHREDTAEQLQLLKSISEEMAFKPSQRGDTVIEYYNIEECLSRVQDNGGWKATQAAIMCQAINENLINNVLNLPMEEERKIYSKKNNISPERIFDDPEIRVFCSLMGCIKGKPAKTFGEKQTIISS